MRNVTSTLSVACVTLFAAFALGARVAAAPAYYPIDPTMTNRTVTLTGKNMTVEQVIEIARYGAKVELSAQAKERTADAFGLLLEGATEGVPIY